jgi:HK97 family phage major capsid protein
MDLLELKDKRNKLVVDMRVVNDRSTGSTENDGFANAEDRDQYQKMENDIVVLDRQIKRTEALEAQERETAQNSFERDVTFDKSKQAEIYERAFDKWARFQEDNGFSAQERSVFLAQNRAATTQTAATGGVLVPRSLFNEVDMALKAYGGVYSVARILTDSHGNTLDIPTLDDTANKSVIVAENTDIGNGTDLSFGSVSLSAYKYKTGWIKVPQELIEDSDFNITAMVTEAIVERNARALAEHLTTGTGSGQPQGVVTGASSSGVSAGATALTADNVLELIHKINPSYRRSPSFYLMFNDATLLTLRKLKDSQNNYIFNMGVKGGAPDTIFNVPFVINDDMASIATGATSVIAGDFSKYIVRTVNQPRLVRTDELFKGSDQVAFNYFQRVDAKIINSAAIKKLTHA